MFKSNSIIISSVLVTFNEASRLEECLRALNFCDEIVVNDMGSTDESITIANQYASSVRQLNRADVVEKVWNKVINEAKNDWIILVDPDEVYPEAVFTEIANIIQSREDIAMFAIPWKFYFLGKPLISTHWGREHFKARVFNRKHVEISGILFDGIKLKPGYECFTFPYSTGYIIKHYWVDSIPQLFSKHWRYIKNNGEARYKKGQRFSLGRKFKETMRTLRKDLFEYGGMKDGWRGIFLSIFHGWFIFMCHLSLLIFQIKTKFQRATPNELV